jgi:hypothetical protein
MHGSTHIVLNAEFDSGRLKRKPGQTLCSTRNFWGLKPVAMVDPPKLETFVSCSTCLKRARMISAKQP